MTRVLVDSSFLIALINTDDKYHQRAIAFAEASQYDVLYPDSMPTEAMFVIGSEGGVPAQIRTFDYLIDVQDDFVHFSGDDFIRARAIMRQYADNKFDFVDTMIMAMAERLNITHVLTFDRRDFSVFRPLHADYFTLLP